MVVAESVGLAVGVDDHGPVQEAVEHSGVPIALPASFRQWSAHFPFSGPCGLARCKPEINVRCASV